MARMSTPQGSNPTLAQADTLFAAETPPSPVDAGGADFNVLFDEPRYSGGALLGQGGMGEVRLFRDRRLGREVAVKVLRAGAGSIGARRLRFVREARVQGQLEHPSVVPVYDLELGADGEARMAMKRVRGLTLEAVLSGLAEKDAELARRFSRRRLLTAFVSVCRALDYAHARGIVHRDVKPANVMLGEFGEVHLLDWGIAKIQGSPATPDFEAGSDHGSAETLATPMEPSPDPEATAVGALLGTPGYMSPEQARGENDVLDARSDVFALGAMLFEILTLTPMIDGRTIRERLERTRDATSARSPASEAPEADVPPELDEAVRAATAPRREDRYSSAGALAEAVDRYLDGDRDMAARKALAGEQVERAREVLSRSKDHAEEAEMRAEAVRALTRAVALDPHHQEASELLGQLLVETPRELPKGAAEELSRAHAAAAKTAAMAGVFRMVGVVVLSALGLWMGLREASLGLLGVIALFVASALSFWWLRASTDRAREAVRALTLVLSVTALTVLSYAFGPSILVPALCMVNGFVLLGQADFRSARLVIAASTVPVLWQFALGVFNLAAMPYEVTLERILIPAKLVSFPPALTLFLLAFMGVLQVVAPLAMMSVLRGRLRSLEERLFLHSYHLRQLASSPAGEPSPPA